MASTQTLGQILINQALPPALRDPNRELNKKSVGKLLDQVAQQYPDQYKDVVFQLQRIGDVGSQESGGFSPTMTDLRKSKAAIKIQDRIRQQVRGILEQDLDDTETNRQIVEILGKSSEEQSKAVYDEALKGGNRFAMQAHSGARGKSTNVSSLLGSDMMYEDHHGNNIPVPILSSYAEGLTPEEYWCLAGGTQVRMSDGSERAIEDVEQGDWVLGADKQGNTFPVEVLQQFSNGTRDCQDFTFRIGRSQQLVSVQATSSHKVLATPGARGQRQDAPSVQPLGTVVDEGYRMLPAGPSVSTAGVHEPRALLLGLLLGDGYLPEDGSLVLTSSDAKLVGEVQAYVETLGMQLTYRAGIQYILQSTLGELKRDEKGQIESTERSEFKQWLAELGLLGKKSAGKFIPDVVYTWDQASVCALISGLMSTDGSVSPSEGKTPHLSFCSTSQEMFSDLIRLLKVRCGIHVYSTHTRKATPGTLGDRVINRNHDLHSFTVSDSTQVASWAKQLSLKGVKSDKLREGLASFSKQREVGFSFFLQGEEPLGSIETFDIEVDHPDHLFVLANGMVVSNSGTYGARMGVISTKMATANAGFLCLYESTPVEKVSGSVVPIKDLRVGDRIYGSDLDSSETRITTVTALFDQGDKVCSVYTLKSTHDLQEVTVICTGNHKFKVATGAAANSANPPCEIKAIGDLYMGARIAGAVQQDGKVEWFTLKEKMALGPLPCCDIEVDNKDHLFHLANGMVTSNSKQLNQAAHRLVVDDDDDEDDDGEFDVNTARGYPTTVDDQDNVGALLSISVGGYERNTPLTPKILGDLKRKGIEDILVRSPITSHTQSGGVRARDVGVRENGGLPSRGESVGLQASQAIGEPVSQGQLCLWEDTHVRMANKGIKLLRDIFPGDEVLGCDKEGRTFPVTVLANHNNGIRSCHKFSFVGGDQQKVTDIRCTMDHKILGAFLASSDADDWDMGVYPIGRESFRTFAMTVKEGTAAHRLKLTKQISIGKMQTRDLEVDHPDHLFVLANGIVVSNSSKHSGGIAGQEQAVGGFKYIDQLVQIPGKLQGGAAHSEVDGKVKRIFDSPTGGKIVQVHDQEYAVPEGLETTVKVGDEIEAGDTISTGIPHPATIVKHKGIGEGRKYYTEQMLKTMGNSGMYGHRRNVEMLSRGMINHVKMTDEVGDYNIDDIIPYHMIEKTYKPRTDAMEGDPEALRGQYLEKPVLHYSVGTRIQPSVLKNLQKFGISKVTTHAEAPPFEPKMIRGLYQMQNDPDWMTQQYGSGLQKSLLDSTAKGSVSDEAGSSFIPSLAAGTNFGAPKPGSKPPSIMGGLK